MKSVILLEDEGTESCRVVQEKTGHLQFQFLRFDTPLEVESALTDHDVFALVFNAGIIQSNLNEFVLNMRREYPEVPLIVLLNKTDNDIAVSLLQSGARACLQPPLQYDALSYQFSKIFADRTDAYNPFSVKFEERKIIVPNDFGLVVQVVKDLVYSTLPTEERNKYQVILGLNEIVNNAIEHGNLGITSEEKSEALKKSKFFELAWIRSNLEQYKKRVVTINSRVYPEQHRVEYIVEDEGDGFNWRNLPNPKDQMNLLKRNGRGIMIAMHAFDEVVYNEKGNCATLVYFTHKAAQKAQG